VSEFRADLHCHTSLSDGSDAPLELLAKARAAGLKGLSITDHDTIEAYTDLLFQEAKRQEIRLVTGVELSSELEGASLHILGYGFDLKSESLSQFLSAMRERRRTRNLSILERLSKLGMQVSEEELHKKGRTTIGRPHIAQVMVEKGFVGSTQEAFERYLKEGASCYTFGVKFHPQEAIDQIHRAQGKAVLAHPHFIKAGSFLRTVLSLPFDGIECHYAMLAPHQIFPWLEMAKKKGWIATGGSDYHGTFKPHINLGCSWVSESVLDQLESRGRSEQPAG
jgi:predicted metal-dependent phosphoesterase TrpH